MAGIWVPLPFLLPSQGDGIDAKLTRQVLLAHPQRAMHLDNMLPEALALSRERDVPKELDDLRYKVKAWRGAPFLPIGHRVCGNAELLSHFLLQESQIETLLSEMIPQGTQFFGTG
jgi:hypothetical protein